MGAVGILTALTALTKPKNAYLGESNIPLSLTLILNVNLNGLNNNLGPNLVAPGRQN